MQVLLAKKNRQMKVRRFFCIKSAFYFTTFPMVLPFLTTMFTPWKGRSLV